MPAKKRATSSSKKSSQSDSKLKAEETKLNFRRSTSPSPSPLMPGRNSNNKAGLQVRIRTPPPALAIAILVGMYTTIGIAAKYNNDLHPAIAAIANAFYCCGPMIKFLDFVDLNIAYYLFFGYTKQVLGVIAALAVGAHVIEPIFAVKKLLDARAKYGDNAVPLSTVAVYAVFVFFWGVGSFGTVNAEIARLAKQ